MTTYVHELTGTKTSLLGQISYPDDASPTEISNLVRSKFKITQFLVSPRKRLVLRKEFGSFGMSFASLGDYENAQLLGRRMIW